MLIRLVTIAFILTMFYTIFRIARKLWRISKVDGKMSTVLETEEEYSKVVDFNNKHGNHNAKKKTVEKFINK